uniref:Uncharacterized protein n=1 Tax=Triticum urartu TaxID=4572 RepID=A0A8R7QKM3_TRIUA
MSSQGHDSIWVIIDHLPKLVILPLRLHTKHLRADWLITTSSRF